ncbi:flippase [Candidatus Woesearchaeota archaeon]|nr:flippase [Candidatus Woesearchaeota archaeon]
MVFKKILKNSFWLGLAEFFSKLSGFVNGILIARAFGAEGFGQYSFALAFVAFFVFLPDIGTGLVTREIAKNKKLVQKYLANITSLKIILAVVMILLLLVVVPFLGKPSDVMLMLLLTAASLALLALTSLNNAVFRAYEQMHLEFVNRFVERLTKLLAVVLVVVLHGSLLHIFYGLLISSVVAYGISLLQLRKLVRLKLSFDLPFVKHFLAEGWPFAISTIFGVLFFRIDTVMLSFMQGEAVVGWYNAATNLLTAVMVLPTIFVTSLYPVLSRSTGKELHRVFRKSAELLTCMGLVIGGVLFLAAPLLIRYLYGIAFLPAVAVLGFFAFVLPFKFLNVLQMQTLFAKNKQRQLIVVQGIAALVNVVGNWTLIPMYGMVGATLASVGCEILLCMGLWKVGR